MSTLLTFDEHKIIANFVRRTEGARGQKMDDRARADLNYAIQALKTASDEDFHVGHAIDLLEAGEDWNPFDADSTRAVSDRTVAELRTAA